jgi:photosystem II stability/assembly factor-like uncharacterized protein
VAPRVSTYAAVGELADAAAASIIAEVIFMRKSRVGIIGILCVVAVLIFLAAPAQAGTWSTVPVADNVHYNAVDLVDGSHGWAGGVTFIPTGQAGFEDSAIIGRTVDGGATWEYATGYLVGGDALVGWNFRTVTALDFVDGSHGWATLDDGAIVATSNGGADWVLQAEGSFEFRDNNWSYVSLSMADATHGCAVGSWVGFIGVSYPRIVYTVNGTDWKEAEIPDLPNRTLDAVHMVDAEHGWAVGSTAPSDQTPLVLVTHDGGATWTRQATSLPPTGISLHGVWFVDRQHGWVVGDSGTILVTVDGGATWWTQLSPTTEKLLAVRFAGPATGWAVGEKGTVLETTTAGLPWVSQTTGVKTTLRAVAVAEGTVWVAGEEGVLLASTVPSGGAPGGFSDVASSPYKTAIESLAAAGIISGFPDGTFRPDATVLRQQFAKMIVGALHIAPGDSTATRFTDLGAPDVNGYPHRYVQAAFDHAITNGTNPAKTLFAPLDPIRRDQVVSMIVRGAKQLLTGVLEGPPAGTSSLFAHVGEPHGENLRIAEYNGLLDGLAGMGSGWDASAPATRGEVAQMLYELWKVAGAK